MQIILNNHYFIGYNNESLNNIYKYVYYIILVHISKENYCIYSYTYYLIYNV